MKALLTVRKLRLVYITGLEGIVKMWRKGGCGQIVGKCRDSTNPEDRSSVPVPFCRAIRIFPKLTSICINTEIKQLHCSWVEILQEDVGGGQDLRESVGTGKASTSTVKSEDKT